LGNGRERIIWQKRARVLEAGSPTRNRTVPRKSPGLFWTREAIMSATPYREEL